MLSVTPKHKVFVSFHHADEYYRNQFENIFSKDVKTFISRSVQDGDIDQYMKTDNTRRLIRDKFISDSTVTIVLIGENTWKRKHVDWEIGYSLTSTTQNRRSGLLGILLPSYRPLNGINPNTSKHFQESKTEDSKLYTPHNIPPRLYDNIKVGYAKLYSFPINHQNLMTWIDDAFQARNKTNPTHTNSRSYFKNNRNDEQVCWQN